MKRRAADSNLLLLSTHARGPQGHRDTPALVKRMLERPEPAPTTSMDTSSEIFIFLGLSKPALPSPA